MLSLPWCIHSFCQEPIWAGCSSPQPQPRPHPQLAKSQSSECTHSITAFSLPGTGKPVLILLLFTHQPTVICCPHLLKAVIAKDIHSLPVAQARGHLALLFLGVLLMSDIIGCLLYSDIGPVMLYRLLQLNLQCLLYGLLLLPSPSPECWFSPVLNIFSAEHHLLL